MKRGEGNLSSWQKKLPGEPKQALARAKALLARLQDQRMLAQKCVLAEAVRLTGLGVRLQITFTAEPMSEQQQAVVAMRLRDLDELFSG
jgi:hypothetical protein